MISTELHVTLAKYTNHARRVIDRAVKRHKLTALIALFSGGPDSIVSAQIASEHPLFRGCIHINTKTSPLAEMASRHAIAVMDAFGWDYEIGEPFTTFRQIVAKNGFPGPAAHGQVYQYLKHRPITAARKKWMARLDDDSGLDDWQKPMGKVKHRIGFITGIRAEESQRRSQMDEIELQDGVPWISPILLFKREVRDAYLEWHVPSINAGSSREGLGECDCGAYAVPGEMEVKCTLPLMRQYVEKMEEMARLARELDLIEVAAGMRSADSVIGEGYTQWGHGLNTRRAAAQRAPVVSICNDCDGQLTFDGSGVGEDFEYLSQLRESMQSLSAEVQP